MSKLDTFFECIFTVKLVLFVAIILSISAWALSYGQGYVLTYNDAASHLNIARRIVDNYTPGFAQIGTVWLPFPHMVMLLLAWNDFMWKTALAGSLVSMGAYVVSVVFTYKTIELLTGKRLGAFVGAMVVALNPNFLYLQSTPMTESLLLAMFVMAVYYLTRYIKTHEVLYLIATSLFVMLSTLIRYDGWFLFVVLSILIPLFGILRYGRKRAEGDLMLFGIVGGLGIALWVLWNWVIFGDPMYFITGPYSAYAQQKVLQSVGQLPTAGSWFNAAYYYMWSVIGNNGIVLSFIAAVFAVFSVFVMKDKYQLLIVLAVLSPFLFNVIALYIGQSAMNVPQAPTNPGMFNTRYGIMMLPAIGLLVGYVSGRLKYLLIVAVALLGLQSFMFYKSGVPISLADGLHGLENTYYTVEASKWLVENYKGGLILTTLASHDAFVARAHIPMKNYIHEGNAGYFERALKKPSDNIQYIALLTFPPDAVYKELKGNEDFEKNYVKIHNYKEFEIYERRW